MGTYRIKIEETTGTTKHIAQITLDTENIDQYIDLMQGVCHTAIESAQNRQLSRLNTKTLARQFLDDMGTDFDYESVGDDISNEEFIENEMFFARQ
jgi:hypothetical protein